MSTDWILKNIKYIEIFDPFGPGHTSDHIILLLC